MKTSWREFDTSMTLVVAVQAIDGVAIASDSRATVENEFYSDNHQKLGNGSRKTEEIGWEI